MLGKFIRFKNNQFPDKWRHGTLTRMTGTHIWINTTQYSRDGLVMEEVKPSTTDGRVTYD